MILLEYAPEYALVFKTEELNVNFVFDRVSYFDC